MKKLFLVIIIILITIPHKGYCIGVYTDAGRVSAFSIALLSSKNLLKTQEGLQMGLGGGYGWLNKEISDINDFQKQFNTYLDSFNEVIAIAAEVYGLYYELNHTIKYIKNLEKTITERPMNTVAVAFSTNKSKFYRKLIFKSVDIIMDIKKICLDDSKMTEAERIELAWGIRPKIREINKTLRHTIVIIRCTNFLDILNEIDNRVFAYDAHSRKEIAIRCMVNWKRKYQAIGMK